jgi:glutathionyl-hydroquinone reductase
MSSHLDKTTHCKNPIKTTEIPFFIFQGDRFHSYANCVEKVYDSSLLEKIYFHDNNIALIQNELIAKIYEKTRGSILIDKQNKSDIIIFMRYIFKNFADTSIITKNKNKIRNHIKYLNNLVIDDILPNLLAEVVAKCGYNQRAFGERTFLNNPVSTSKKCEKTLPSLLL